MSAPERDLALLKEEFREPLVVALRESRKLGYTLRPFFTRRNPWMQACFWRQSRPTVEIQRAVRMLENQGAPFLADVLHEVGPQHGRWATNALPGQSFHQWLEACDCFVLESGRAIWSRRHPGYQVYAEESQRVGLEAGHFWRRPDSVHVQLRRDSVRDMFTWSEINDFMVDWYTNTQEGVEDA